MSEGGKPSVSVIIPTYNRAHLIGRAIQSVLNQTYQDFEIITVDDGSTDNTEEVVRRFRDERIRYIRHQKNKGVAVARNTGVKASRAEYVAFLDSDDEWLAKKLERQMEIVKNAAPRIGVVYTGFWRIKDNKRVYTPSSNIKPKEGDIYTSLLKGNFVGTSATLVRKECFGKAGMFDERLPPAEDWEMWIRISKCYHFECIDEPLAVSYHQPDSLSANQAAYVAPRKLILEKHLADFQKDRTALATLFSAIGGALCSSGELKEGRSYFIKAVRANPLSIRSFLQVLTSLLGQSAYNRAAASYRKIRGRI